MDATSTPPSHTPRPAYAKRQTNPAETPDAAPSPRLPRQARRTNLTDAKLDKLAEKRLTKLVDVSDITQKGLVARVRPNGARAFYFKWRPASGGGTERKFRSVRLDAANVAEARKKASAAAAAVAIGRDPRVTAAVHNPASAITVAAAIGQFKHYLTAKGNDPKYVTNAERLLRKHMEPDLGNHRLIDLTQRDISHLYAKVMAIVTAKAKGEAAPDQVDPQPVKRRKGRPVNSTKRRVTTLPNRLHTQVAHMLRWATEEGIVPPGAAPVVRRPVRVEPSQQRLNDGTKRVLRVGHFARIWLAVEDEPIHVRVLVRLLILMPLRREEMTGMMWPWVKGIDGDENVLTLDPTAFTGPRLDIPSSRMKGKRPQLMPLPPLAAEMLKEMAQQRGTGGDHVFSVKVGRAAFAGW
jgi:integrase